MITFAAHAAVEVLLRLAATATAHGGTAAAWNQTPSDLGQVLRSLVHSTAHQSLVVGVHPGHGNAPATHLATHRVEAISDVCAQAPAGVQSYVDDVLGWVKYGVIAIIIGAGFASCGAMVIGKIGSMGRAAQVGASGLMWTVIGAIAFVTIYGVLNAIIGQGC